MVRAVMAGVRGGADEREGEGDGSENGRSFK